MKTLYLPLKKEPYELIEAGIKISRDLYRDFKETLPDATKLGEEIARRWNECETKR